MTLKCPKCNRKGIKSFMSVVATGKVREFDNQTAVKIKCFKCGFEYTAFNTKGVDKNIK